MKSNKPAPNINPHSKIVFHKLNYIHFSNSLNKPLFLENINAVEYKFTTDSFAVVRKQTDETLIINRDGLNIIKLLCDNKSVKVVANKLGYTTDQVIEFAMQLISSGFIKRIDSHRVHDHHKKIHPWFAKLKRKYFRMALNRLVLLFIWFVILYGIYVGIINRPFWPKYSQYFWTDDPLLVSFSIFVISNLLIVLHESGHFIMTKALGGEAKMSFSHRYLYLVAQTSSYYVNFLPVYQKVMLYISGMLVDLFTIAVIYLLIYFNGRFYSIDYLIPILLTVVLLQIQGIIWQFNMHLETDIYNTFNDLFGFDNLRATVKSKWMKLVIIARIPFVSVFCKKHYFHIINDHENRTKDNIATLNTFKTKIWYFYNIMLVAGFLFTTLQFAFLIFPRDLQFFDLGMSDLLTGINNLDIVTILKSLLLLFIISVQYILWSGSIIRQHHKAKKAHGH